MHAFSGPGTEEPIVIFHEHTQESRWAAPH